MRRTILSAAASSRCSSSSALYFRPLMAKLQCRTFQYNQGAQLGNPVIGANRFYIDSTQVKFRKVRLDCSKLACKLPSINYAKPRNILNSQLGFGVFSANNLFFSKRCFSQVPKVLNKKKFVGGGGDGNLGANRLASKGFYKGEKKHKMLANQADRGHNSVVTASKDKERAISNKLVNGNGAKELVTENSTLSSPASGSKQDSKAGSKPKLRSRSKKTKESSSPATASEATSTAKSSKSKSQTKTSKKKKVAESTSMEVLDTALPKTKSSKRNGNSGVKEKSSKSTNALLPKKKSEIIKKVESRAPSTLKPMYPPSGKSVVVVESTTKAKVIQGYLGDMYEVLPSYGHIRDLAARSGSVRPDDDFSMVWEVPSAAWTHLKSIKVALNGAENLILASDPDREGEAIAWHIIEMLHQQDSLHDNISVARVVFHEITESAIKTSLQTPREIDANLVHAYLARRALDYLIGFNISPLLWRKLPGCQSAGRVQSAALALICDREMEIDEFKPQEYWSVAIKLFDRESSVAFPAHLTYFNSKKLNQHSISSETEAKNIEESINLEKFQVIGNKRSTMRRNPPTPYITSTLQQDAANKLHFSTTYTMKLAQKLYEGVQLSDGNATGLITYMRTDGLHISDEAVKDIRSLVTDRYGQNFTPESPRKYFKKVKNAQEAHEAIRPTDIRRLPSMLNGIVDEDSLKLYTLIWARAVACQMEPATIGQIQVDIGNASESIKFRSTCSKVDFLGFQAVYEDVEAKAVKFNDDEGRDRSEISEILSSLKQGDSLRLGEVDLKQHHTQPPPRYSEGSLVKKLEELGIGRPSTYASTLKVLQDRKYVTIKKRVLYPEFRGRMVSAFLSNYFTEVTDYSFTADMETELDNVSAGLTEWKGLLGDYWTRFSSYCTRVGTVHIHQVEKMLEKKYGEFLFSSLPDQSRTCPSCQEGTLIFKVSRFGAGYFIGCDQHPRCKYIAKTLYGENEDDNAPPKNINVEEPKLLGLHPGSNEKVLLKSGPYGVYVQLGEDRTGYLPKRSSASHIKEVDSITLEVALTLLRYPLTLGSHPTDGQPVILKLGPFGFTVKHRRSMASVPKNIAASDVTMEKALELLSGKDVRRSGRPKSKPKVKDEDKGGEAVEGKAIAEAM